ncbi:MAG: TrmH family RNA methyltransferase [Rhodospirillales bacterium]
MTTERCDSIVRIPMAQQVESLNLASAASIALYERSRGMAK